MGRRKPARVLDTVYLIRLWHGHYPSPASVRSEAAARAAAQAAHRVFGTVAIVTPVRIEFLAGLRDREELRLADIFLGEFELLDEGRVVTDDWREAERLARRVPHDGRARDLGDCLVRAIADRLNAEVLTQDQSFPR